MKQFLKNIGIIVMLVGVCILAIPSFIGTQTNITLSAGLLCVLVGFVSHIIILKRLQN